MCEQMSDPTWAEVVLILGGAGLIVLLVWILWRS